MYQHVGRIVGTTSRGGRSALGALERRSPLPAGRYRISVVPSKDAAFQSWRSSHAADVRIESNRAVDTTPSFTTAMTDTVSDALDWINPFSGLGDDDEQNRYTIYDFTVKSPVPWDATVFGFPDILTGPAPVFVPTSQTSPTPATPGKAPASAPDKQVQDVGKTWALGGAAVLVAGLGIFLAYHARSKRSDRDKRRP